MRRPARPRPAPPRARTWRLDLKGGPKLMIRSIPSGTGTDPNVPLVLDRPLHVLFLHELEKTFSGSETFSASVLHCVLAVRARQQSVAPQGVLVNFGACGQLLSTSVSNVQL